MASFFNLILDTLAPQGVTLQINSGAEYTTSASVTLTIGTTDTPTTGYQMKIWGISTAATEAAATWETFATTKSATLPSGDGLKTVYVKLRDNVLNESAAASASITLDTAVPAVTVTGPDVGTISTTPGADEAKFSFVVDQIFTEYKVKVVPSTTSLHDAGTQIPVAGGSINMSGVNAAGFPASTAINCTINGTDLKSASGADGTKIIKVFAKDKAGNWSVT